MLQELPAKAVVYTTYFSDVGLCLEHVPVGWKKAKVIMIHKPEKPLELPTTYRLISLFPIISNCSKIFPYNAYRQLFKSATYYHPTNSDSDTSTQQSTRCIESLAR